MAYNTFLIKCGDGPKVSSLSSVSFLPNHTRHTTYKDADTNAHVGVLSFCIPIATKRLLDLSFKESKALAFHSLVRAIEQRDNNRCSYTVNALHELTGVHARTIEDRLRTLERMNLVAYDKKNRISLKKAKAKHRGNNTYVTIDLSGKPLKDAERSFLATRIVNRLRQINRFRDVQNQYHEICSKRFHGTLEEIKNIRSWLRGHCKNGCTDKRFTDFGWAYKNIARYLGTSITKAVEIVKYAVEKKFIAKKKKIHVHENLSLFSDKLHTTHFLLPRVLCQGLV